MNAQFIGVYGETCAGKSTLGGYLSSTMGPYISFGDLKRDEIANKTETGCQIEDLLRSGSQIRADLGYKVIRGSIRQGLNIISGYPISLDEFELISGDCPMTGVVVLQVNETELLNRFTIRRECPKCHVLGADGDVCPVHRVKMTRRQDATREELAARRRLYRQRIAEFLQLPPIAELPRLVLDTSRMTRDEVGKHTKLWIKQLLCLD